MENEKSFAYGQRYTDQRGFNITAQQSTPAFGLDSTSPPKLRFLEITRDPESRAADPTGCLVTEITMGQDHFHHLRYY